MDESVFVVFLLRADDGSPSVLLFRFVLLPERGRREWEGGLPRLVNDSMEELCRRITGKHLADGEAFWQMLQSGRKTDGVNFVQAGEQPIVRLSDGKVYSFRRKKCVVEGDVLYELGSTDVTGEYRASIRLEEHKEREAGINRRLRGLADTRQSGTGTFVGQTIFDLPAGDGQNRNAWLITKEHSFVKKRRAGATA